MDLRDKKNEMDALVRKAQGRAEEDEPVNIDADPNNADWLRSMSWDIWTGDPPRLVKTAADFLKVLGVDGAPMDAQREAVQKFMKLPAARPMPAELKRELARFL